MTIPINPKDQGSLKQLDKSSLGWLSLAKKPEVKVFGSTNIVLVVVDDVIWNTASSK